MVHMIMACNGDTTTRRALSACPSIQGWYIQTNLEYIKLVLPAGISELIVNMLNLNVSDIFTVQIVRRFVLNNDLTIIVLYRNNSYSRRWGFAC